MGQSEPPQESAIQPRQAGLFRRSAAWLFSQRHFHFKLLSGTAAGVSVIVLLAGIFLYVTVRNHQQEMLRAHTIEVIRLSSLVENDIAALETGHRGLLLSGKLDYVTSFNRRQETIRKNIDHLTGLILNNPKQRKRVMKVQEVVQNWIDTVAQPDIRLHEQAAADPATQAKTVNLGNSLLDQARSILQSLQDEEQIVLNQRMLEQEWATQSSQMLDFLPKLERSVL
jgi:CHASE3 domain sensor protein